MSVGRVKRIVNNVNVFMMLFILLDNNEVYEEVIFLSICWCNLVVLIVWLFFIIKFLSSFLFFLKCLIVGRWKSFLIIVLLFFSVVKKYIKFFFIFISLKSCLLVMLFLSFFLIWILDLLSNFKFLL